MMPNDCYAALHEGIETNSKAPKFKIADRVRITNNFGKGYTKNMAERNICC